jgi:hypothetical protein
VVSPLAVPAASPLLTELRRHGLGGKAASDFIVAHPADYLEQKIAYLDFLIETGEKPKKPAGWLRTAIEEDYGPPAGYVPKTEREQIKREQEQQQRQADERARLRDEDEKRKQSEAEAKKQQRRQHIEGYLDSLSLTERQELEEAALTKASGFEREFLNKDGPIAATIRQNLIDAEVLLRHPLP